MKNKILLVISILFGLLFVVFGLNKFLNFMPPPEDMPQDMMSLFAAMMEFKWLIPLVGVVEVISGVLVMIPKFRALGAIMIFPIIVGILLTHIVNDPSGLVMALIVTVIDVWLIIENKDKYMPMIQA